MSDIHHQCFFVPGNAKGSNGSPCLLAAIIALGSIPVAACSSGSSGNVGVGGSSNYGGALGEGGVTSAGGSPTSAGGATTSANGGTSSRTDSGIGTGGGTNGAGGEGVGGTSEVRTGGSGGGTGTRASNTSSGGTVMASSKSGAAGSTVGTSGVAAGSGGKAVSAAGAPNGSGGIPNASATSGAAGARACDATKAPTIKRLGLQTVVQSTKLKMFVHAAQPIGSNDWYLVDVLGYVYVFSNGVLQNTPFLDVSAEVQESTYASLNYDERGLLSITFAPDYQTSGKFYVALTPTSTATEDHDLILEFKRSATNPLVADTSTRRAILDLPPGGVDGSGYNANATGVDLNKYHNASTVVFGPDGMLYVGLGDGGGQCNSARPGVPQDITSPYGKILRLDPNAAAPFAASGNPFASNGDPRVLHWGLRNPYRFGFDSLTGDLFVGDVGQWDYEEISYAPAGSKGLNFGWPDFEANDTSSCNTTTKLATGATHTPPIATIAHPAGSGASSLVYAIVGGTVYRGSAIPELYGAYIFGEYYANHDMRALYQCGSQTSPVAAIKKQCDLNQPNDACFAPVGSTPQLAEVGAIVEGNDGELYLAANNNALLKIVPAP